MRLETRAGCARRYLERTLSSVYGTSVSESGAQIRLSIASPDQVDGWRLRLCGSAEAFSLVIHKEGSISLAALEVPGLAAGVSFLLQLIRTPLDDARTTPRGLVDALIDPETRRGERVAPSPVPATCFKGRSPVSVPIHLPCIDITESPRFPYRGLLLDSSRHFIPLPDLLVWVDLAASLRLNRLHLHLCDDQGWRLPVPGLERLTTVGAWRHPWGPGGPAVGGSYTLGELEHLVAYAAARGIEARDKPVPPPACSAMQTDPCFTCALGGTRD